MDQASRVVPLTTEESIKDTALRSGPELVAGRVMTAVGLLLLAINTFLRGVVVGHPENIVAANVALTLVSGVALLLLSRDRGLHPVAVVALVCTLIGAELRTAVDLVLVNPVAGHWTVSLLQWLAFDGFPLAFIIGGTRLETSATDLSQSD